MKLKTKKYDWRIVLSIIIFAITGVYILYQSNEVRNRNKSSGQDTQLTETPVSVEKESVPDDPNADIILPDESGAEN